MKYIPLGTRVVIKRDEEKETTASGIILTNPQKNPTVSGVVIGTAGGVMEVSKGQRVMYSDINADQLSDGEESFDIVEEASIFAILGE